MKSAGSRYFVLVTSLSPSQKPMLSPVAECRGLIFLDTETTGLAGGTGTYAFLVGAAQLEDDRVVVTQFFMRDLDEEPALLAALAPLLERATGIVTFNGAGFDLPLLETRFVLARRRWPAALPHLDLLRPARRVWTACLPDCRLPTLEREVFGPIVHVLRYRSDRLEVLVDAINATRYGLTFGIHTRIDSTARRVAARVHAGNVYVNRNMIGAVVGVQPFGGCGLSGTGPKAGGPHYLQRFAHERTLTINTSAVGGNASLLAMD